MLTSDNFNPGINIIYPTMINVFYITPTTTRSEQLLLTLPGNLGLVLGACLLIAFGNLIGHWKWTLSKYQDSNSLSRQC